LWDTAGQEVYRSITRSYYRGAQGAIIVYDITSKESFSKVGGWLDDIRGMADANTQIALVGNKSDLEEEREVSTQSGLELAKSNGLNFMETSARSGKNVNRAFQILLNDIHTLNPIPAQDKKEEVPPKVKASVVITGIQENKDRGCPC